MLDMLKRLQYFQISSRIFEIFSQFFKQHRQNCSMFVPIRAETSLIIDHQENVGKKREKMERRKKEQQGHI